MAEENIQLPVSNMTGDRTNTNLYCFSGGVMLAKKRGSPYSLQDTYPVDTYVGDVECTQFDGYYYWSLEKQTNGFTIKKWELDSGILRQQDIFSYADDGHTLYDADSFAVDSYNSYLTSPGGVIGSNVLPVDDVDVFDIGDNVVIGPSSDGSFTGEYEKRVVSNKAGSSLILDLPLTKTFSTDDFVYTNRFFYVFNKYSPFDSSRGSMLQYRSSDGILNSYSATNMFGGVTASCFYEGRILFIKGNELILLNATTLNVYRHIAIDNLRDDRGNNIPIYAIWAYSDVLYRLQDIRVYYDGGAGDWAEESWSPYYHYTTDAIPTEFQAIVYFVNMWAYPNMIHAVADGVPTTTSNITITVLNQDRTPLSGRSVSLSATRGSLVPNSGTTNSDGQFVSVYNGTSHIEEVEITATVT